MTRNSVERFQNIGEYVIITTITAAYRFRPGPGGTDNVWAQA
jgi:hypothetical protein